MKKINFIIIFSVIFILFILIITAPKVKALTCPTTGATTAKDTVETFFYNKTCNMTCTSTEDKNSPGYALRAVYPYYCQSATFGQPKATPITLQQLQEGLGLPKPEFVSISDFAPIKEANKDYVVFLKSIYDWGIGLVGVLAFVMITYGGILYMVSGDVGQKGKAKGIITDALIGLALALSSFIILNIVRPQALEIKKAEEGFTIVPIAPTDTADTGEQPYASAGTGEQCLTYPQLQSLADQGYTCGAVTVGELDCPKDINNPQGSFICTPPSE